MTESLEISLLGHPILRQKAQKVKTVHSSEVQALIDALIDKVTQANGVGIAAPQVGHSLCIIIVASHPNPRYPDAPLMQPTAMINPRIVASSSEQIKGWEGCLSVPGRRGFVKRSQSITVEYFDHQGKLQCQEFTNFIARIIQHEIDHLQGMVFLDRLDSPQDLVSEQEYQQILQKSI